MTSRETLFAFPLYKNCIENLCLLVHNYKLTIDVTQRLPQSPIKMVI